MVVSPSILGPGAVLALAIGLLAAGLRGRRQDRHPVCRQCGFDLFGLPPDSNRCSECGADLRRRRATRIGNRRRSTRTVGLALALLLPTLAWFGTLGWIFGSGAEVVRYKPVWWLTADAHSEDPATRDVAFAELLRRVRAVSISDAQLAKVVDRALSIQGNDALPWDANWGNLIEAARDSKRLSDDRWRMYLRQATGPALDLPIQLLPRGRGLPVRFFLKPARMANRSRLTFTCRIERIEYAQGRFWRQRRRIDSPVFFLDEFVVPGDHVEPLPSGMHRIRLPVLVEVSEPVVGSTFATTPIDVRHVVLESDWELAGEP